MKTCQSSPLVSFLRTYGPSPQADVLSDENVRDALATFGVRPVDVPPPQLAAIVEALCGDSPTNVVLTGTAGDGKTYHIRQFLLGTLGLDPVLWPGDAAILEAALPDGTPLRVIRDLSELEDDEKEAELGAFIDCLTGQRSDVRYLVAANDGQLLRYFRQSAVAGALEVHAQLASMLRSETTRGALDLMLLNLSRSWSGETVDAILDQVLEHPDWNEGCDACPGLNPDGPCPIRLNRSILRGDGGNGRVFRERLKEALRLGAANDSHVPVRYLIMLCVNILLGDGTVPDDPLLDCEQARTKAAKRTYGTCNPYENALGLNVPAARRSDNPVFAQLAALGLGDETNNALDETLSRGKPEAVSKEIFGAEPVYGEQLFEPARHAYYVAADRDKAKDFRRAIATQRRRAFFRLAHRDDGPTSPWRLTILHHAGLYLKTIEALGGQPDRALVDQVTRRLIKGLNRTLLGMMAEETERLWLASTIGRTDDTVGRIATVDAIARAARAESIRLEMDPGGRRPRLRISSRSADGEVEPLDLRPLLFEYLLRVEEGSLPASFSRQCQQEARQFALIAAASFGDEGEEQDLNNVHVLSLGASGVVDAKTLEV